MVDRGLKAALKYVRAIPAINAPIALAVRGAARRAGVSPEFAIRHLPRAGVTRMTLPGGQRARLWSRGDDWVSNQVFWRGWDGYEPEVARVFWRLASAARVTLDVGAHVGYFSVLAALAAPQGTVFAFEPLPAVYERLRHNIALNRLANVIAVPEAAGAHDAEAEFFHVPGVIPSSSSLSADFMRGTEGLTAVRVPVTRLDSFLAGRGIDGVDLIKIDTETTEPDVLSGLGDCLSAWRPDIICEVLTRADVAALTSILEPVGYRFFLLTDAGPQRRESIVPDPRWLNYLFTAR